jgi:hypothetical protein
MSRTFADGMRHAATIVDGFASGPEQQFHGTILKVIEFTIREEAMNNESDTSNGSLLRDREWLLYLQQFWCREHGPITLHVDCDECVRTTKQRAKAAELTTESNDDCLDNAIFRARNDEELLGFLQELKERRMIAVDEEIKLTLCLQQSEKMLKYLKELDKRTRGNL